MTRRAVCFLAVAASLASCSPGPPSSRRPTSRSPIAPAPSPQAFHRGVNFDHVGGFGRALDPVAAADSLDALVRLGVTHISITPSFFQRRLGDAELYFKRDRSSVDGDIRATARLAHERGLAVLLKPHLWLEDRTDGAWRGRIDPRGEAWAGWQRSYRRILLDYARLAAEEQIAGLSIGSELTDLAVGRPAFWRALIADLRVEFDGYITYASNWNAELDRIEWWDACDYVAVDAFWPLTDAFEEPLTEAGAIRRLRAIRAEMLAVASKFQKPVILTEIGFKSAVGAAYRPWEWHSDDPGSVDLELQATVYRAMAQVFPANDPSGVQLRGVYIWKWYADLDWGGPLNSDFTPNGKPAAGVLADWYGGTRP